MSIKPTILIADDEEGIRESLRLILEADYSLLFATNGEEAVTSAKAKNPELVILDIKMPKMSGLEVLKQIKSANPSAKVIILTGYQCVDIAQEAVKNGALEYLVKPFKREEIQKAVKKHI